MSDNTRENTIQIICASFTQGLTVATATELNKQLRKELESKGVDVKGDIIVIPEEWKKSLSEDPRSVIKSLEDMGYIEKINNTSKLSSENPLKGTDNILMGYRIKQQRGSLNSMIDVPSSEGSKVPSGQSNKSGRKRPQ
jgi:hypothetical protein